MTYGTYSRKSQVSHAFGWCIFRKVCTGTARISGVFDAPPRRIGLLGGTFDPPHRGHVAAAVAARDVLEVDLVLLVVAGDPWQKTAAGLTVSPAAQRLAMVEAAVAGHAGIRADDTEIRRGGPSYTVDTLDDLGRRYPGAEVLVLVGADVAADLDTWKHADELRQRATIVLMDRPGHPAASVPDGWACRHLEVATPDVTSTEVRALVAAGRPASELGELLPAGVASVIDTDRLYRPGSAA